MQAAIDRRTFVAGSATGVVVSALMGIGLTRAQAEEAAAAGDGQTHTATASTGPSGCSMRTGPKRP